uniref:Uncharacterized protein n=1 Tax=Rhizophora mucronata TaxID=61149 RepID=A0A2P2J3A9_RHIMU
MNSTISSDVSVDPYHLGTGDFGDETKDEAKKATKNGQDH